MRHATSIRSLLGPFVMRHSVDSVTTRMECFPPGQTPSGLRPGRHFALTTKSYCSVTVIVGFSVSSGRVSVELKLRSLCAIIIIANIKRKRVGGNYAGNHTGFDQRADVDDAPRGSGRARYRGRTATGDDSAPETSVPDGARRQ